MSGQGIPFKRIDKQYDNAPSVTSKLGGNQKAIFALLNLQDSNHLLLVNSISIRSIKSKTIL